MKKKLFASLIRAEGFIPRRLCRGMLIAPLVFAAAVIFAGCSNPSSSSASSSDVAKGSVIVATYSDEGSGTQIVFNEDNTVEFRDNGGASTRAVSVSSNNVCAYGTYVVTADNVAQITITKVLRDWGDILKDELDSYKSGEVAIKVAFNGNDLQITVGDNSLSFSTDKKDVSKPTIQSGPLFKNGAIDATYLLKQTLTLENGNFSTKANISFGTTEAQGKYTQSGNTITFTDPKLIGGEYATKATATISDDTLTLVIEYDSSDTEKIVFKKYGTSWEHSEKVKLSSNGDITYFENGAICWNGTYTIIDTETASVKVKSGSIKDIFGTDQGNLYIEDASQEFLDLDLHDLDENGGTAILFAREK